MNKTNVKTAPPQPTNDGILRHIMRENAELNGRLHASWDENKRLREAWQVDRQEITALHKALVELVHTPAIVVAPEKGPAPAKSVSDNYLQMLEDRPTALRKEQIDAIMRDMACELLAWRRRG